MKRIVKVRWRKDREKFEVDYIDLTGRRLRPLFDTEEEALAEAAKVAQRLEAGAPVAHDPNLTLGQAFERYYRLKARKRSLKADRRIADHLTAALGKDTRLRDLTAGRIAAYKERRLAAASVRRKDANGDPTPLSAASINRPLALLRHLLRLAHQEWEVIPTVPRIKLEREPEGRIRWLEPDEEARLLAACEASKNTDLANIVTVALESGMRHGEVMGLTWERVDLSRGVIKLEVTKSGKRREVPMRQVVYDVLSKLPGLRQGRVWPERSIRTAFETAVAEAKLEDFTFHDCRHHFASWFVMRGGNLQALQKILGHATLQMTMRYAHLAPDYIRAEVVKTERRGAALEPKDGTSEASAVRGDAQVVESEGTRRGSSEAEQLIRNQ